MAKKKAHAAADSPATANMIRKGLDPAVVATYQSPDAGPGLKAEGYPNEEAMLLQALHLMHRKSSRERLTAIDEAFLQAAAQLFQVLADTCRELAKRST